MVHLPANARSISVWKRKTRGRASAAPAGRQFRKVVAATRGSAASRETGKSGVTAGGTWQTIGAGGPPGAPRAGATPAGATPAIAVVRTKEEGPYSTQRARADKGRARHNHSNESERGADLSADLSVQMRSVCARLPSETGGSIQRFLLLMRSGSIASSAMRACGALTSPSAARCSSPGRRLIQRKPPRP